MPTTSDLKPCLCGCGALTYRRFAPGHDQRYLGQCLNRISAGDPTGPADMEQYIPGHAGRYDMGCLRANVGRTRAVLRQCFLG
jgi:hypothetical protein